MNDESKFSGTKIIINEDVQYIGEDIDPAKELWFNMWREALKDFYRPGGLLNEKYEEKK